MDKKILIFINKGECSNSMHLTNYLPKDILLRDLLENLNPCWIGDIENYNLEIDGPKLEKTFHEWAVHFLKGDFEIFEPIHVKIGRGRNKYPLSFKVLVLIYLNDPLITLEKVIDLYT